MLMSARLASTKETLYNSLILTLPGTELLITRTRGLRSTESATAPGNMTKTVARTQNSLKQTGRLDTRCCTERLSTHALVLSLFFFKGMQICAWDDITIDSDNANNFQI